MTRPSRIHGARFNEVYGSLEHQEDKSHRWHHDDSRHFTRSSGPQVYMPMQGDHGSPPSLGSVNIGVASGNVNTGPVNGSLYQSDGVRRTAAPQPTYPPPHHPPYLNWPAHPPSQISHSQRQPYALGNHPFREEPLSLQREPFYHNHDTPRQYSRCERDEEYYPPEDQNAYPQAHPQRPSQYRDAPPRDRHSDPPQSYFPQEYPQQQDVYDHAQQKHIGCPPPPQAPPPMKSRNPFNPFRAGSVPQAYASEPPPPQQRHRAATTDYTRNWVAAAASHTSHRSPREDGSDFNLTIRSPSMSEDTRSSSGSSSSPVYWGSPPTSSSYATTPNRYSPVAEEPEDYLHVEKRRPRSRSSSPGLC